MTAETAERMEDAIIKAAETTAAQARTARANISAVIFGQQDVIDHALITVLSGGHALLVGLPGLAKTKLVETMGVVLGMDARRIQFTPDLMPSDILGSEVLEESATGQRGFRFVKGPVFTQLLMADEINRASPRTQSALLQAMQEHHVTVAGETHDLPKPFHVLATQNPLEQEGTYPLPEAQLDRFLMQVDVGYPDLEAERRILFDTTGAQEAKPKQALTADDLMAAQRLVRRLPVGDSVVDAILTDRRRPDGGAAARPPPAGGRFRRRCHPDAGALRPPRRREGRTGAGHRLGSRPACLAGADARRARPRADRRPPRSFRRRRAGARRACAEAPHGPVLRGTGGRPDGRERDRHAGEADRMT